MFGSFDARALAELRNAGSGRVDALPVDVVASTLEPVGDALPIGIVVCLGPAERFGGSGWELDGGAAEVGDLRLEVLVTAIEVSTFPKYRAAMSAGGTSDSWR